MIKTGQVVGLQTSDVTYERGRVITVQPRKVFVESIREGARYWVEAEKVLDLHDEYIKSHMVDETLL